MKAGLTSLTDVPYQPMTDSLAGDQGPVASRIKTFRQARGWSQEDAAVRMRAAGFAWLQSTLTKTESGARPIRLTESAALAQIFGVMLDDLVQTELHPLTLQVQEAAARLAQDEQELDETRAALRTIEERVTRRRKELNALKLLVDNDMYSPTREPGADDG